MPERMTSTASIARAAPLARRGAPRRPYSSRRHRVDEFRLGRARRIHDERLAALDLYHRHRLRDVLALFVELHGTVGRHDVRLRERVAHPLRVERSGFLDRALVDLERGGGLRRVIVADVFVLLIAELRVLARRPAEDLVLPR